MQENIKTSLFRKITSSITLIAFVATSVIGPTANAGTSVDIAPASGLVSNWGSWSANANNFVSMPNLRGYGTDVKLSLIHI